MKTYVIDFWLFTDWSGDPKRIELTLDREPLLSDIENVIWEGVKCMHVVAERDVNKYDNLS